MPGFPLKFIRQLTDGNDADGQGGCHERLLRKSAQFVVLFLGGAEVPPEGVTMNESPHFLVETAELS